MFRRTSCQEAYERWGRGGFGDPVGSPFLGSIGRLRAVVADSALGCLRARLVRLGNGSTQGSGPPQLTQKSLDLSWIQYEVPPHPHRLRFRLMKGFHGFKKKK